MKERPTARKAEKPHGSVFPSLLNVFPQDVLSQTVEIGHNQWPHLVPSTQINEILRTFHMPTIGKAAGCHNHKDLSGLSEARPQLEVGTICLGGINKNGQLQDSTQYPSHEIIFPFLKPLLLF